MESPRAFERSDAGRAADAGAPPALAHVLAAQARPAFTVLAAISFCHLLNDMLQSLLPAIYPILKSKFALSFGQVGLIALTGQITASVLQPVIGLYTDRRPQPFSLAVGMTFILF